MSDKQIYIAFDDEDCIVTVSGKEEYSGRMAFLYVTLKNQGEEPQTRQWCYKDIDTVDKALSIIGYLLEMNPKFHIDDLRKSLSNIDHFRHRMLFRMVYEWRIKDA